MPSRPPKFPFAVVDDTKIESSSLVLFQLMFHVGVGVTVGVLVAVAVAGTGVLVDVAVAGAGVFVAVAVAGTGVSVDVAVGGSGVFVDVAVGGTGVLVAVLVGVPLSHGSPFGFVHEQYIPFGIGGCKLPQLLFVTTPLTATQ